MDETTKVIIATISGFIIAFFAEPIKTYFQTKAKLRNLKIALHKELLFDYWTIIDLNKRLNKDTLVRFMHEYGLRTECYQNAIKNDVSLFYQLKESHAFNTLHNRFLAILIDMRRAYGDKPSDEWIYKECIALSDGFRELVVIGFFRGNLDKEILKKIVSPNDYNKWMTAGKEWSEGRDDVAGFVPHF